MTLTASSTRVDRYVASDSRLILVAFDASSALSFSAATTIGSRSRSVRSASAVRVALSAGVARRRVSARLAQLQVPVQPGGDPVDRRTECGLARVVMPQHLDRLLDRGISTWSSSASSSVFKRRSWTATW